MPREVYLVLVEYGQTNEQAALDLLIPMLRRVFPGATVRGVVVDNALGTDGDPEHRFKTGAAPVRGQTEVRLKPVATNPSDVASGFSRTSDVAYGLPRRIGEGGTFVRIVGDNSLHEFSGWDRGLAWLEQYDAPAPESIVVLANDTVVRADKHDRVRDLPADRVRAAADGALIGWVEEYPRSVELFGLPLRHFIDTSLVIAQRRTLAALGPFARPPADAEVFADDWRQFFREPSPLSDNYRAYLRTYYFGERIVPEFDQRWYAHEPIGEGNFEAFKAKLRCVFCEHLLSARARATGIPLVDIRPKQLVISVDGSTPRVSVIVPCYNLGAYLDEAVESVLAQSYQDFEILIVDDGSTDAATRARLSEYQRPETRVIQMAHGGLAAARNLGIANARGEYLCALDADDRFEPSFLAKAVRVLDDDPSITFVSSWLRNFGDEAWDWKPERCDLPALLCENTVSTAALVRREAVLAAGGYDTAMPVQGDEDWDLWLTLVEQGHRGVILPEALFNYRRRAGSMSSVSWYGSGHLPLASYRFVKHRESYRAHLLDVFRHQDSETAGFLRQNDHLEQYIGTELEPAVASQREELARLRARLSSGFTTGAVGVDPCVGPVPQQARDALSSSKGGADTRVRPYEQDHERASHRIRELEEALHLVAGEANALRTSMSWRVTSPLREVFGWWLRWRGTA